MKHTSKYRFSSLRRRLVGIVPNPYGKFKLAWLQNCLLVRKQLEGIYPLTVTLIPGVSQANGQTVTKKVTTGNVIDSTKTVLNDTAVNGTISAVTGKIAGKIVPTNNGWFKPQKFVSAFAGKYAIKSELQTLTQSGILFGVEGLKYSFNQRLKQGQQPIITFFPDTEIRAAR